MAETPDFPWSPLSREALDQVLASAELRKMDLEVLRWLVWLSLLSVQELTRLVKHYPASISVPKLVTCYPVTRTDLLARLARPVVHLALSALMSRLIAESPAGYRLTSYQQPWKQTCGTITG